MTIETHITTTSLDALSAAILPGDPSYEEARRGFNLAVDQHPAAIAYPRTAADVAALVRAAAAAGLRVAVQGGAHNAEPQGDLRDALLLRTNRMDGVRIDPVARRARVEAGVLWEAAVDAAAEHGLAALHGSSPDVGIVGYSLGGGMGWLARRHGLQAHRITAAQVVTADGEIVEADEEREPELLWALRGGGGNFGVVTELEFELLPLTHAYAGMMAWDWSHAERVLQRWADWAPQATEDVTTSARIMQLPWLPQVPELIRGRQLVMVDGAVLGDPDTAAQVLAPLRELAPEIDLFGTVPIPALTRIHGDPEEPLPYTTATATLRELPPAGVSEFVRAAGPGSGSPLLVAELRQLGGALGRPGVRDGALAQIDGAFVAFALGGAFDPEDHERSQLHAQRVLGVLEPYGGARPYLNFVEQEIETAAGYEAQAFERLRSVRTQVDPTGVFRANHAITA